MKLMTEEVKKTLPKLCATEKVPMEDKLLLVKFFDPTGRGTWYATEFDGKEEFFGYVVSPLGEDCDEWGYFYLSQLENVRVRMGLRIERDLFWHPIKFSELKK